MQRRTFLLTVAGGTMAVSSWVGDEARAQTNRPVFRVDELGLQPPQTPQPPPAERPVADGKYPLQQVVKTIGERAGVLVLGDSTVADDRTTLPPKDAVITPTTVDNYIAEAVKNLDEGIVWAQFNLPPPPKGKRWTGDDLAAYALGLMRLYGAVGAGGSDGTVEILAQAVPIEQATPIFNTLNLQPVWLVTRRTGKGTFTGTWDATFGVLKLRQESSGRVRGSYTGNDGSIDGRIVRGVLEFRWFEAGNNTAGGGRFMLSEDGDTFTGVWWNDGEDYSNPSRSWSGKRLSYKP